MYGMQKSTSLDMKDMPRVPSYPSFSACPSIGSYVFSPQYTYVVYPQHQTPTSTHTTSKLRYRSMSYDDTCIRRGSSTVAIDNKIEQAMDLVKSHLMFAVREEVEVLKEQIKDLLEKIGQLEYENRVLKDNASQETLSKLTVPKPQPPSSSS